MSVHFGEGTKPGANGKGKNEVTEENEDEFNAASVVASESKIALAILNNARRNAFQKKLAADPRFNQNDELSNQAYSHLEKYGRKLAHEEARRINSTEASEIMRESKAQIAAKQIANEIMKQSYNNIVTQIKRSNNTTVGSKRPRPTEGGRRTRRKRRISRKCK